jgi:hypothetical protein
MPDHLDPLVEATGRVVIAAGRLDGAIGVLAGYALGDRSGRIMPGSLDALIRLWGDYIVRERDLQTRARHQAARTEAVRLGRARDDLIHSLWIGANQVVKSNRVPASAAELALAHRTTSDLRRLATRMDAHAATVLALAAQIVNGERA